MALEMKGYEKKGWMIWDAARIHHKGMAFIVFVPASFFLDFSSHICFTCRFFVMANDVWTTV